MCERGRGKHALNLVVVAEERGRERERERERERGKRLKSRVFLVEFESRLCGGRSVLFSLHLSVRGFDSSFKAFKTRF